MSAALFFRAAFDGVRSAAASPPSLRLGSWKNYAFALARVYSILYPDTSLIKFVPRVALICVFLFCIAPLTAFAQYRFDVVNTSNGLPQNSVRAIQQTRDGYLWFTTLDGLVRYNGARFEVFNKANSKGINSNRFVSLFEDVDGTGDNKQAGIGVLGGVFAIVFYVVLGLILFYLQLLAVEHARHTTRGPLEIIAQAASSVLYSKISKAHSGRDGSCAATSYLVSCCVEEFRVSIAGKRVCILRQSNCLGDALSLGPGAAVEQERFRYGRITSVSVELPGAEISCAGGWRKDSTRARQRPSHCER